jgi:hypothetical protein
VSRSLKLGNGDSPGRGREVVAIPNVKRRPRAAPKSLVGKTERAIWRRLWSNPISVLWETDEDEQLVRDLILLRTRLENEGAGVPLGVFGQIRSLEDRLILSPRARRVAGIVLVDPEPASSAGNGARKVDRRRREQMIRGDG